MKRVFFWLKWPKWSKRIWALTIFLAILGIANLTYLLISRYTQTVSKTGGTYFEAMLSRVQTINPYYYLSGIDKDLCALLFSGLTKYDPVSKEIRGDLAYKWDVNTENTEFIFYLRSDLFWHDGLPLTSDDVIFSYQNILQSPDYLGAYQMSFYNVQIEALDATRIKFTLKEPQALFPYTVTLAILPKHILESVPVSQLETHVFNRNPIGSGPFKFTNLQIENGFDIIDLHAFSAYYGPKQNITEIVLYGYNDMNDLLRRQDIFDGIKDIADPLLIESDRFDIHTMQLPRVTGIFFNLGNKYLAQSAVRKALRMALDKDSLLSGIPYIDPVTTPVPYLDLGITHTFDIERAKELLYNANWKIFNQDYPDGIRRNQAKEKLHFIISTTKSPENVQIAQKIQESWKAIGVETEIVSLDIGDLQESLINPRKYDILLIGEELQPNIDIYPYFHSSQIQAPGLNLSQLKKVDVDLQLDKIRSEANYNAQILLTGELLKKIDDMATAVYLYSPQMIYYVSKDVMNVKIPSKVGQTSDRLYLFNEWAKEKKLVWK